MECIITIELGTNAVRVLAFDLKGNVIGSRKGAYPTFHPEPDYSEQDPEQIFITMLYVLKSLLNESINPNKHRVIYICFSASMHSVLPIDKNGVPLGNAIIWADNRGKKVAQQLRESSHANTIYRATGTPIHPMSPLIKIAWLSKHDKDRFKKASKFLSIKSYIIHQLTGSYILDYSLASATGLLNIQTMKWEQEALDFAGIKDDKLPELVSVFHSLGKLRSEYERSLGLPVGVKVLAGSSDGCLATLGAGVWSKGKATITIEDSGAVRLVRKQVLQDEKQRFFNYLLTEKCYISGGPTNNGGLVFEWFTRQFGDFHGPYDIEQSMESFIAEAAGVPAGAAGLIFTPYLLGERAPLWDANARGCYFGLNIKHERSHFIRATLEGILFEIYSIGKTLEEYEPIKTLSVNGSFASIPFCTQMIADIFDKEVHVGRNPDTIAFGAFLLSATDLGIYQNLEDAANTAVAVNTFKPQQHHHGMYQRCYSIFERLSTKLKEEFESIASLQNDIEDFNRSNS